MYAAAPPTPGSTLTLRATLILALATRRGSGTKGSVVLRLGGGTYLDISQARGGRGCEGGHGQVRYMPSPPASCQHTKDTSHILLQSATYPYPENPLRTHLPLKSLKRGGLRV